MAKSHKPSTLNRKPRHPRKPRLPQPSPVMTEAEAISALNDASCDADRLLVLMRCVQEKANSLLGSLAPPTKDEWDRGSQVLAVLIEITLDRAKRLASDLDGGSNGAGRARMLGRRAAAGLAP